MNKKIMNLLLFLLISFLNVNAMDPEAIRQQFLALQQKAGIPSTQAERQRGGSRGRTQSTREQRYAVRATLNTLLSKDVLTQADIQAINQNIAQLESYNAMRWPRPNDYRNLLAKKTGTIISTSRSPLTSGIIPPSRNPQTSGIIRPPAPRRRQTGSPMQQSMQQQTLQLQQSHESNKQQFLQLQQKAGISTPLSEQQRSTPMSGQRQGNRLQFNIVRSTLNTLLSKAHLTQNDINLIDQNIQLLDSLKPARFPRAKDYRDLLNKKLSVAPPLPPKP